MTATVSSSWLASRAAEADARMTTPALPETGLDEETLKRLVPPYRVILHNDDHNSMDHVVRSLLRCVPSLTTGGSKVKLVD